jgi:hypothetical protein
VKVNKEKLIVEVEDELDETSWEELVEGLPDSGPRFVAYRFEFIFRPYCLCMLAINVA